MITLEVHCFSSVSSRSAFGNALYTSSVVLLSNASLLRDEEMPCVLDGER